MTPIAKFCFDKTILYMDLEITVHPKQTQVQCQMQYWTFAVFPVGSYTVKGKAAKE